MNKSNCFHSGTTLKLWFRKTSAGPTARRSFTDLLDQLHDVSISRVDNLGLAWFRIGFGLLIAGWAFDYLRTGRLSVLFKEDLFHFTYYGFGWVKPWSIQGMTIEFVVMLLCGVMISVGVFYRAASALFAVCFTHYFLIDKTNYQNHYYLICLMSWVMLFLPANRTFSVDVLNGSVSAERQCLRWCLFLIRFHVAIPYVYGGIAKLEPDWLSGIPAQNMLASRQWPEVLVPLVNSGIPASLLTWGGVLFDLGVVPCLLWRKTRLFTFILSILFHLSNSILFPIHVFPWFMIFSTTVFFPSDVLRRFIPFPGAAQSATADPENFGLGGREKMVVPLLAMWCLFHLLWPLRHFAYDGVTNWTERGHFFSWRMMLRGKASGIRYSFTDPKTKETWTTDIRRLIDENQSTRFARDPAMILDLAHFLAAGFEKRRGSPVEVRAFVLTSLNGRKPQLLIDPKVNLAAISRASWGSDWIVPLVEPLRAEPWTAPLDEWEQRLKESDYHPSRMLDSDRFPVRRN